MPAKIATDPKNDHLLITGDAWNAEAEGVNYLHEFNQEQIGYESEDFDFFKIKLRMKDRDRFNLNDAFIEAYKSLPTDPEYEARRLEL